jgi:dTDP-4-amino-4,6-dideoxygalactose transaminase
MNHIPFNKPYFSGNETEYIRNAVLNGKISGDGFFTKKCHDFFENKYGFKKVLLTTSCTSALEMAAILLDIKEGDEIIAPSYTFVSTVNAFVLRGAKIIFIDSCKDSPNMDVNKIEASITSRTKVILPVHYAGIACDMDKIMSLAKKYNVFVVEDAAQAIDSYYKERPLGSIGHLAAFSFHETKNIISGEGGMLVINDDRFIKRAEIIREKGTNRSAFFRGEIDKYEWVDIGSSYLPSEITAAFLYAQLQNIEKIQLKRKEIWNTYNEKLGVLKAIGIKQSFISEYATNNAHIYYIICRNLNERSQLIHYLKDRNILAIFHYLSLHKSPFYNSKYNGEELINADLYSDTLLRLPLYYELKENDIIRITDAIITFYNKI